MNLDKLKKRRIKRNTKEVIKGINWRISTYPFDEQWYIVRSPDFEKECDFRKITEYYNKKSMFVSIDKTQMREFKIIVYPKRNSTIS